MSTEFIGDCNGKVECLIPAFEKVAGTGSIQLLLQVLLGMMHGMVLLMGIYFSYQILLSLNSKAYTPMAILTHGVRGAALATTIFIIIGT
ncbi:hypothetical protein BCU98_00925 [Vibrio splendidus]|nr:hypothetical protein BCU98_00925 [Vibrio splendidus]